MCVYIHEYIYISTYMYKYMYMYIIRHSSARVRLHLYIHLQCVAVCCSVLQCVAVCCSVLPCIAVRTFRAKIFERTRSRVSQFVAMCSSVLQCVAVCCGVLQCVEQCCRTHTSSECRSGWRGGGLGSSTIFKNLMSPTRRRKWYLTTGRRAH